LLDLGLAWPSALPPTSAEYCASLNLSIAFSPCRARNSNRRHNPALFGFVLFPRFTEKTLGKRSDDLEQKEYYSPGKLASITFLGGE